MNYLDGHAPVFLQRSSRKPKGYVEISDPEGNIQGGETLMCSHCQQHWIIDPGSGKQRGWCFRCNGPTCGKKVCEERCIPFEKAIEIMERKDLLRRRAVEALHN